MLGPCCQRIRERTGAAHAEAVYLRGGGGRALGEAGRQRRVRDRAQGAHRNEPESPPSAAPPRGPARARAPLPPTSRGPAICMRRARPRPPYPSGLCPAGSALSRRSTLVPGPRSVLEPSGRRRASRGSRVKRRHFREGVDRGLVLSPPGAAWKSLESAPLFFRLRPPPSAACAEPSPPIGARAGGAALFHAQGLSAPARGVVFSRVQSRISGLSLQRRPECRVPCCGGKSW